MHHTTTGKRWKASELRQLPREQRDAILAAAAARAEEEYRTDPNLTAFDAFEKEELHDDREPSPTMPSA